MSRIPLALLPGTLCTAALWEAQVASLGDLADVTVIDTSQHDSLSRLAEHVHKVMPAHFAVAGLSYGGIVALAVWRHNPQAISHLGLLNTTPLPITPAKLAAQKGLVKKAQGGEFKALVSEHAQNLLLLAGDQESGVYRARIVDMAETIGINGFANQIKAQINRPDSRTTLHEIQCPTLVLCGECDTLCPPKLHAEMADAIPNSCYYSIADCGHLSTMEQPENVSHAMREWLLS